MKIIPLFTTLLLLCSLRSIAQEDENKVVSKFDFIPGEKVVFYDDFTAENIGDFPLQWNTNSSGEIVTYGKYPGRWFQMTGGGYYIPEAKEKFTDNFTVEFDLIPLNTLNIDYLYNINFIFVSGTLSNPNEGGAVPGKAGTSFTPGYDAINWTNWSEKDGGYKDDGSAAFMFTAGEKYHIAFWIQKQRIRMYANETKVLDLPRGLIAGYTYNIFRIQTTDELKPLIANFKIAAGLPDMRNKLLTEGKLISYGIQFDVNSDKIKPESYATIKEIAQILKDNATLKIKIIGHTDSDGDEALNLDLSKRRSISVKEELNNTFGIDNARIETEGKGETQAIAPNDNMINKAKNRRVEFIKL
ncbi:MAG: OmpA family protein [Chitinophagaceae bacterium]|nr:OmpA family protein [Chitinophagaceae bacterium]